MALPYLDRLTLEIVPDQNAEALRLVSGQVDRAAGPRFARTTTAR